MDDLDIEVDVTTARGVGDEREAKSVCAASRNTLRERRLLVRGRLLDLGGSKIAHQQLAVKSLELGTVDDAHNIAE